MRDIGLIEDGVVGIRGEDIVFVGTAHEFERADISAHETLDAGGRLLTPGLIDPHTHLVHGGSRQQELAMKLAGKSYLEILEQGGGILSTVKSTRAASEEELEAQALQSLHTMLEQGTTTVEAKSGYGLERETELKQLKVANKLNDLQPVEVVSTFLGPHALPPEYRSHPDEFLDLMIEMLDEIKEEKLAEFCDIFCESGVFSVEQSRRFLAACKNKGFDIKIHADEIEPLGGTELAAELGATSVEHLLAASKEGLQDIAKSGTIAVILPGTSWNLRSPKHADARYLIDEANGAVALATDYNPGSCPTESLQLIMAFGANLLGMTPEEILTAVTRNAAYAIGRGHRIGTIEVGKQADLCLFNTDDVAYIPYHFGINHVDCVFKKGRKVVSGGKPITD
ncbi:imidazolonepropionase [Alicyclobacillus sp. SO9]|nr:imidazolonepropionase [Alicyclobacillus sp. SO9]